MSLYSDLISFGVDEVFAELACFANPYRDEKGRFTSAPGGGVLSNDFQSGKVIAGGVRKSRIDKDKLPDITAKGESKPKQEKSMNPQDNIAKSLSSPKTLKQLLAMKSVKGMSRAEVFDHVKDMLKKGEIESTMSDRGNIKYATKPKKEETVKEKQDDGASISPTETQGSFQDLLVDAEKPIAKAGFKPDAPGDFPPSHLNKYIQNAQTLGDKIRASANVDTRVFDPLWESMSADERHAVGLYHNEALRILDQRYNMRKQEIASGSIDPRRHSDIDRINQSMDSTKETVKGYIDSLRKLGKDKEANWYENHGLPLVEEARKDLLK